MIFASTMDIAAQLSDDLDMNLSVTASMVDALLSEDDDAE